MSTLHFDCRFRYPSGFHLDLSFTTTESVTALLGPSGAGKSTTLHLIAGLLCPAEGRITMGDRALFDSRAGVNLSPDKRHIGLVFQDYQLFPHLSVEANLRYGLQRYSPSDGTMRYRNHREQTVAFDLMHLIDVLELRPLLNRYPHSLSGGQRQRVAFGRAIASSPAILLLDEPVSALDADLKSSVLDYLARLLAEYSIPTLLVTHDIDVATRLDAALIRLPACGHTHGKK